MDASTGKREWIYPAWVKGAFQTRRRWTFTVLHIILFITPWIHVRDRQIIQLDLSSRQLILAGEIFTPQDTVFLVFGLLFSTFLLFFVTAMWGRIWCGYACPQTVFLETFVHAIERRIEGNHGKRMALDRAAWTPEKIAKKVTKHAIFLAAAGLIGACFVGWFVGTRVLFTGNASSAVCSSSAQRPETASAAASASRSVPSASTSAMATSWSASAARSVWMPALRSWVASERRTWSATAPRSRKRAERAARSAPVR